MTNLIQRGSLSPVFLFGKTYLWVEENIMKLTHRRLQQIIKEEIRNTTPFGSGMEQVDVDAEQKDMIGHT